MWTCISWATGANKQQCMVHKKLLQEQRKLCRKKKPIKTVRSDSLPIWSTVPLDWQMMCSETHYLQACGQAMTLYWWSTVGLRCRSSAYAREEESQDVGGTKPNFLKSRTEAQCCFPFIYTPPNHTFPSKSKNTRKSIFMRVQWKEWQQSHCQFLIMSSLWISSCSLLSLLLLLFLGGPSVKSSASHCIALDNPCRLGQFRYHVRSCMPMSPHQQFLEGFHTFLLEPSIFPSTVRFLPVLPFLPCKVLVWHWHSI